MKVAVNWGQITDPGNPHGAVTIALIAKSLLDVEIFPALAAWRDTRPAAATTCLFTSLPVVKGSAPGPLDARDIGRIVEKYVTAAGLPPELRGANVL